MKTIYLFTLLCLLSTAVKSQYVEKVTNINYYGFNGLNPTDITVFDGKLYFFGTDDPQYVDKLMFTADGSAAGVTVVRQIDSVKQYPSLRHLTILNNLLIFDNHTQLWKSDGTTGGTSSIATLRTSGTNYVVLNNKVYFAGDNTNSSPMNDQLWQTDGTASGTTLVKTINSSGAAHIGNMYVYGGMIYFYAWDGAGYFSQPWISDGTAAGTRKLKVVKSTSNDANPSNYTPYNGKLYFSMFDDSSACQLWVTDGTTAGTLKVTKLNAQNGIGLYPASLTLFSSKIFFRGYDENGFSQLWSTDGTASGTVIVKADLTHRSGYTGFSPISMAVHNTVLYMAGYDSLSATVQLWASDGTTAGTIKVTSFPHGLNPSGLYSFQNKLIMTGADPVTTATELFFSDGTAAGTICPTPPSTGGDAFYPWEAWVPFNNALYYKAAYGYFADYQLCRFVNSGVSVKEIQGKEFPEAFVLFQNYPNPFNPSTSIRYGLPHKSAVQLIVYNTLGQQVAQLVNGDQEAGYHEVRFDGSGLASGVYFYKLQAGSSALTKKMIVTK